jgi:invasion protein IalB
MATRQAFTSGQILTSSQCNDLALAMVALNAQTGTSYTTVLTDDGKLITLNNAAAITLTIPLNATVAYGIGTQINIMQLGAGQVTITPTGGVTINSAGTKLKTNGQYSVATVVKIATDTWVAVGNLTA